MVWGYTLIYIVMSFSEQIILKLNGFSISVNI